MNNSSFIGFKNSLVSLEISACKIKDAEFDNIFIKLDELISKFPNL